MASTALPNRRSARHSHTPAYADGRSGLAHVDQGNARQAANVDQAAQDTADHQQAEYFVGLLGQSRDLLDQRIDKYESQVAISQASGDVENVRALRRMTVIEETDRQLLSEMIDNLERRFRLRASGGGVPQISRRARPVVR